MRIVVIVNPISGTGGRPGAARERAERASALLARHGVTGEILLTERGGHARELATAAITNGATLLIAWGGDGTVNEVACAAVFRQVPMAVIPSGSGNGLARELAVPMDPAAAFAVALTGRDRAIDCGELDGRLFVNVAGLGLDARVAHEFAAHGLLRRGFLRYLEVTARELRRRSADVHTIRTDEGCIETRALLVAIANARQYGNGAIIAPDARIDDGRLDVVVVADRPLWRTVAALPRLFNGTLNRVPGVTATATRTVEITSEQQVLYHVDGEPFVGGTVIRSRVHARALHVRVMHALAARG